MREPNLPVMLLSPDEVRRRIIALGYDSLSEWARLHRFNADYTRRTIKRHCGTITQGNWGKAKRILKKIQKTLDSPKRTKPNETKPYAYMQ